MAEREVPPSASLIQQRLALQRPKLLGIWMALIFGANTLWWLARAIFADGGWVAWALAAGFAVVTAGGAVIYRKAHLRISAFEDRYGKDAGRQQGER